MPEGEIGDKITKLFKTDEKDTSESTRTPILFQSSSPYHVLDSVVACVPPTSWC